jgi:hypothetical protein
MRTTILAVHEALSHRPRIRVLRPVAGTISAAELAVLITAGVAAALLSGYVKLNLGISGHNIIRVVFPMALGLALVPRRGAASIMGCSALGSAALFSMVGAPRLGAGAMTSLILTGFFLDFALAGARSGRSVYVRLMLAGAAANLVAMLVRGGVKVLAGGQLEGLPLAVWFPKAMITYPLCGALAGLISAAVWFRFASQNPDADRKASP